MKLRIRSLHSKETQKIQVPFPCSLQDLKSTIADKISSVSESLHLSLNRKDEFVVAPQESLQSIGLTSGDLIFYTLSPNGFSAEQALPHENSALGAGSSVPENQRSRLNKGPDFGGTLLEGVDKTPGTEIPVFNLASGETFSVSSGSEREESVSEDGMDKKRKAVLTDSSGSSAGETAILDSFQGGYDPGEKLVDMEIDHVALVGGSDSVPGFLKKVLKEEADNVDGNYNRLLIVAVHGAFLESGFVGFDSTKGCIIDGFGIPEGWVGTAKPVLRLEYSVPSLLLPNSSVLDYVALKVVTLGKYVTIYGSVVGSSNVFHINLDVSRMAPAIDSICKRYGCLDEISGSADEKTVFELWKVVKDELSLPLLMELSDKTGLAPPPCFMRLPVDLKIRILECLPGSDIAKMACVCLELKYLTSNDDLWKKKYIEEFPLSDGEVLNGTHWKEKFAITWEKKKMLAAMALRRESPPGFRQNFPMRRPVPFGSPGFIIGGDYDRLPGFVGGLPFRSGRPPQFPPRRFSPHSFLGDFYV
ncbi:F-box protein SKIP22-like [Aristolochia californica]|uniref:F-box protein SKIP22-like n=1 Tax=Aristolochia californica TaxID=171875 RepID=UPI0035D6F826